MLAETRKIITKKDLDLFKFLIENYNNGSILPYVNSDVLLWKDFLLYFKKFFWQTQDIYTGKISDILKILLNIDQEKHVRSGIRLSFDEWMKLQKL